MEQRFFINEFEQSLKEQADQFQMIPSKKVWHGIYNDLHPGRKWPSIAMSLSLIFTLVVIGHLHTNNQRKMPTQMNTDKLAEITTLVENSRQNEIEKNNNSQKDNRQVPAIAKKSNNAGSPLGLVADGTQNSLANSLVIDNSTFQNTLSSSSLDRVSIRPGPENKDVYPKKLTGIVYNDNEDRKSGLQNYEELPIVINKAISENIALNNLSDVHQNARTDADKDNSNDELTLKAKDIINKASENNTASDIGKVAPVGTHKKRDENINWVYYAAPVVSSVSFSGEFLKETSNLNFTPVLQRVSQKENKVLHNSALGFEVGAQMNYTLTKKLEFTTGAHLTYSGYNIISNQVHPTSSRLVLKDPSTGMVYTKSYYTHYGNGTGLAITTLRNYSWQASIPLGLQYAFYDKNKLQFSLAANIEPSFVLSGNSFILSSDGNTYVNDPSLLRKWNFNSNFGAFVTFSSTKFLWHIGPNIRYQWLSTYQKDYTVKEHLIDYGIRIGISKNK